MPIYNGADPADRNKLLKNYDICIVGSGAVGMSMAQKLVASGKQVIVLESSIENVARGSQNWWDPPRNQDKYSQIQRLDDPAPNQEGSFWYSARPRFFDDARTRCYGGSTNCWGGYIRPLDEYDFKQGAWPITRAVLDPYYREALKLVKLDYFDDFDDPNAWITRTRDTVKPLDIPSLGAKARTAILMQQINPKIIDFQTQFEEVFVKHANMTLLRNATAVNCIYSPYRSEWRVYGIQWRALDTKQEPPVPVPPLDREPFELNADKYVLAMGGLEIPRFCLSVFDKKHDFMKYMGCFYMNHPKYGTSATIVPKVPISDPAIHEFYKANRPLEKDENFQIQAMIVPTSDGMKHYKTANFRIALGFKDDGSINVELNFEQVPTEASCLRLDLDIAHNDLFGRSRAILDWSFAEQDKLTVTKSSDFIVDLFADLTGGCEATYKVGWDDSKNRPKIVGADNPYTGDHHMGTCRMNSKDGARDGAVDSKCKVIGYNNLWICSTGVFPTGGWANATFTLLALSLRLAEELVKPSTESSTEDLDNRNV